VIFGQSLSRALQVKPGARYASSKESD
jgi:hypothetical protein